MADTNFWNADGTYNYAKQVDYLKSIGKAYDDPVKPKWNATRGYSGTGTPANVYNYAAQQATGKMGDDTFDSFYNNNFNSIYNKYLSNSTSDQYGMPSTSFSSYLKEFPWMKYYNMQDTLTDTQKGINKQQYAPSVKWY
ncbi:MAG: hypothetical protein WCX48_11260 [Bacteroidales bacterium]